MSAILPIICLARHGETAWSMSGRHTSTTDLPLTDNGRQVADRLRPVLARETFARVFVSPMRRARETCELACLGNAAIIDPELAEWNYGKYEGMTPEEIHKLAPGWLIFRDGCPGGETPEQVGARTRAARACCALDWAAAGWRPALSVGYRHPVRP